MSAAVPIPVIQLLQVLTIALGAPGVMGLIAKVESRPPWSTASQPCWRSCRGTADLTAEGSGLACGIANRLFGDSAIKITREIAADFLSIISR